MHVAIIMDGNGRWAQRRGLPRSAGHRRGAQAARQVIEAAPGQGVDRLTLFAFSSDNWHRPADEAHPLPHPLSSRRFASIVYFAQGFASRRALGIGLPVI